MSTHVLLKSIALTALLSPSIAGFIKLADYTSRPGEGATAPATLDDVTLDDATLFVPHGRPVILLFFHPKCPCTLATMRSFERLSARFQDRAQVHAVAYCPQNEPDDWIESRTTRRIRSVPGSRVHVDREGRLCRQFGVSTSGHILVYDHDRRLIFSGGITPGRGHEGEGASSKKLLRIVNGQAGDFAECTKSPVFGCRILNVGEQNSDDR